jgi:hypothetical protein
MPRGVSLLFLIALLFPTVTIAKKNAQELPDVVLNAHTVLVVIQPEAGEPVTNPNVNRAAQENVEKALTKWGRLSLVMSAQTADLIIAVRKGHAGGPTISNSPVDQRPVVIQPTDAQTRVGVQRGQPPGLESGGMGPQDSRPHISNQIGASEDSFAVYLGGGEYPLNASPIWRYMGKNVLDEPAVTAVAQFRKAIDDSEKQRQQKP